MNIANNLLKNTYSSDIQNNTEFKKYMPHESENVLDDCNFEVNDVKLIVNQLNNSKYRYFSPRVLKLVCNQISPLLTHLFNKCIHDGYFPDELKIAKIIPLYKNKGQINDICNYRPISMLSVFSKIFEKLIQKQLTDFFDKTGAITSSQYGFRRRHSTLHALINATENLYQSIDKKHHTIGIFIDFSKAFDTVNHTILLEKLEVYGIRGNILKLLNSYLSNRRQYVNYGGIDSTLLNITCGVPQGSVLGPLLFIIFVNDITNVSDLGKFVLFADDLNLFLSGKDRPLLYRNANSILHSIYQYCLANKLIINYEKCCFMEFNLKGERNPPLALGIMNYQFDQVDKCKFLGVHFNSKLTWNDHIDHVISQVSKSCGTVYSVSKHVPRKILRKIYMALIQPYLMYCTPIWGSAKNSDKLKKLFILQKKCIRTISKNTMRIDKMLPHTKPMFTKLKILNIFNIHTYLTACEAMKVIQTNVPYLLNEMFQHSIRSNRLIMPRLSLSTIKNKSFVVNSVKILNYLLDHDIQYNILSIQQFKNRLKRHLLAIQMQSIEGDDSWLPCNHDIFSTVSL